MEKTPSRYSIRYGYNIKITVTGESTDLSRSGQTLVKTGGHTKGCKYNDQLIIYQLLKRGRHFGAKPKKIASAFPTG